MVRETSALMLSQYFKRRRELAEIYATTGEGVGVTVFANAFQGAFRYVRVRRVELQGVKLFSSLKRHPKLLLHPVADASII